MPTEHDKNQFARQELYSKLAKAVSEVERGEKCANAEEILKELMKKQTMQ